MPGTRRIVVAERTGKLLSFSADGAPERTDVLCDVAAYVPRLESVYGAAFHPRFAQAGHRFLFVTYVLRGGGAEGSRLVRLPVIATDPPRCRPEGEEILLRWPAGGHNGGALVFAADGTLLLSTGDGAEPTPPDRTRTGQRIDDLLSSILRLDVDGAAPGRPYRVPPDNPFLRVPGARPEVWAYGLRNPWKMSLDPDTSRIWVGDVGWDSWEMVHLLGPGANAGWSAVEGPLILEPGGARGPSPIQPPVLAHSHAESRSLTGGLVYQGTALPALRGAYVYGDYETGTVWGLRYDHVGRKVTWRSVLADSRRHPVAFGRDPDGELLIADYGAGSFSSRAERGGLYRLAPDARAGERAPFPRRLSQSGLFARPDRHELAEGVVEYGVDVPQWSDGAAARRFVALPDGGRIEARGRRWRWPAGAVLGKTLGREEVSGGSRRFVPRETQILRHDGERWEPFTYRWDADQRDATLVGAAGEESAGWRFDGRAACVSCHSVWAGPVLGFTRAQVAGAQGLFATSPADAPPLPAADDERAPVEARARAYLHVNCSPCHRPNAGGLAALDLDVSVPLEGTGLIATPRQGTFGLRGAAIVQPGDPGRSVLLYRMIRSGPAHMPRLGSRAVDTAAIALLERWIRAMPRRAGSHATTAPDARAALALAGDASEGRRRFLAGEGGCVTCHPVSAAGGVGLGPSLWGIGARATPPEILDSVLEPGKRVDPSFRLYTVETSDGQVLSGRIAARSAAELIYVDAQGPHRVPAALVTRTTPQPGSAMPDGLLDGFSEQAVADLLAFLLSLR